MYKCFGTAFEIDLLSKTKNMKKFVLIGTVVMIAGIACLSFQKEQQLPEVNFEGPVKELPVINNEAFKRGELLTFRMHYGIIEAGVGRVGQAARLDGEAAIVFSRPCAEPPFRAQP